MFICWPSRWADAPCAARAEELCAGREGRFAAANRLTNNVAHGPNLDALRQQLAAPDTVAAIVQLLQYAGAAHRCWHNRFCLDCLWQKAHACMPSASACERNGPYHPGLHACREA